jgi:hypothetical protein
LLEADAPERPAAFRFSFRSYRQVRLAGDDDYCCDVSLRDQLRQRAATSNLDIVGMGSHK